MDRTERRLMMMLHSSLPKKEREAAPCLGYDKSAGQRFGCTDTRTLELCRSKGEQETDQRRKASWWYYHAMQSQLGPAPATSSL